MKFKPLLRIKDGCFNYKDQLYALVHKENLKQLCKWGIQTHTSAEWLMYTTEELGELSQAISEYEYRDGIAENIVKEAIQVATLSLKIAEMFLNKQGRKK